MRLKLPDLLSITLLYEPRVRQIRIDVLRLNEPQHVKRGTIVDSSRPKPRLDSSENLVQQSRQP